MLFYNTYGGKTVQELHCRINAHRHSFYEISKSYNRDIDNFTVDIDDTNVLGAHLVLKHGKSEKSDFNKYFSFTILKFVTPIQVQLE